MVLVKSKEKTCPQIRRNRGRSERTAFFDKFIAVRTEVKKAGSG